MTKIFFNDQLVWDRRYLPNESKAMALLTAYARKDVPDEAAEALSAGIDVRIGGDEFRVELSTDERLKTG